jgi:hypothetical protein
LNSEKFGGFTDTNLQPAVPYLLTFETALAANGTEAAAFASKLNTDQRLVLAWTQRSFGDLFDAPIFDGWSEAERMAWETRQLDTLKAETNQECCRAMVSLAALRSSQAIAPLLAIAADRREKDNRDRWMAVRALGLLGDRKVVPDLVHLLYHYNANTRWWTQISLVRLCGVNFGKDWRAWGKWWNEQGAHPAFKPELVRWWKDPQWTDPAKLDQAVAEADTDFFGTIKDQ